MSERRRRRLRPRILGVIAAATSFLLASSSRGADELEKLLQRPLSPGVVGLLSRHTTDSRIVPRLQQALADRSPEVRGVAARVVAVGGIASALSTVREALAKETDAAAAREEIRALCTIGGVAADPEAFEAVKRLAPRLDGAYVRLLGRLRGLQALPLYFSTLRELRLSGHDRRLFFMLAANRDGTDVLVAAGALALARGAVEDWSVILAVAAEKKALLEEGVLVAALRGQNVVVRGEAAWYLAKTYRAKPPAPSKEMLDAISSDVPPAQDPELRFGMEMLRRVLGKPATEDEGWIACLESNPECHLDSDLADSPLVDLLTEREAEAVTKRNKRPRFQGEKSPPAPKPSPSPPASSGTRLRMVVGLPRGLAADLVAVGKCRPSASRHLVGLAEIEFGVHGLPRRVHAEPLQTSECNPIAQTIFLMSSESDEHSDRGGRETFLTLFDPDGLACDEEPDLLPATGDTGGVRLIRGKIVAPKLVKKPEPPYPEWSRQQLHEGVSVFEAIITPTGCVNDIRVLQSSFPELDISGMEALAHWRYAPATLDGRPVRVYLTVTVTYALKR